ncbi:VOC family protein [bacterium]|nr:VOC family protein [bacterium]
MSGNARPPVGAIGWLDLTVPDAGPVRDFYAGVVGWTPAPVPMDDYEDFAMLTADGEPAAGVCHARGSNAGMPPQWLAYVTVENLEASMAKCRELGGEVVEGPRGLGDFGTFCVVKDPAGAVLAIVEPPSE